MRSTSVRGAAVRHGFSRVDAVALVVCVPILAAVVVLSGSARAASRQAGCSQNIASLVSGLTVLAYDRGYLPPSYVYGNSTIGTGWDPQQQGGPSNPANGYVHWSGLLAADGYAANPDVFTCDTSLRGGAPATNPGPNAADWEPGQINETGAGPGAALPNDRQAKRLAFVANGALMPRNKFAQGVASRHNVIIPHGASPSRAEDRVVLPTSIANPGGTILLTEFLCTQAAGWHTLGDGAGIIRSHRPITPFLGVSAGVDVYSEPNSATIARFRYPSAAEILPSGALGPGMLTGDSVSSINAVGRQQAGGAANFGFLDGHVSTMTVQQSVAQRLWGDRFYSISGNTALQP